MFKTLLKTFGTFSNSTKSNLSISDFKFATSAFLAKSDVSIPAVFVKSDLVA